jgi:hypothetical protein
MVAIAWGFGAALIITIRPLTESVEDITTVLSGMWNALPGREAERAEDPHEGKELWEPEEEAPDQPADQAPNPGRWTLTNRPG